MPIDQAAISRVLDWAYMKALDGGPGLDSAKELVNLGNAIPFVGGFVSGAFDGTTTNLVGNTARRMFVEGGPSLEIAAQ